jgi:hypothetical protein
MLSLLLWIAFLCVAVFHGVPVAVALMAQFWRAH